MRIRWSHSALPRYSPAAARGRNLQPLSASALRRHRRPQHHRGRQIAAERRSVLDRRRLAPPSSTSAVTATLSQAAAASWNVSGADRKSASPSTDAIAVVPARAVQRRAIQPVRRCLLTSTIFTVGRSGGWAWQRSMRPRSASPAGSPAAASPAPRLWWRRQRFHRRADIGQSAVTISNPTGTNGTGVSLGGSGYATAATARST